jgi:cyclophilin family peptidyl-prolyl cis-trans isomerase/HEAT repeat protein
VSYLSRARCRRVVALAAAGLATAGCMSGSTRSRTSTEKLEVRPLAVSDEGLLADLLEVADVRRPDTAVVDRALASRSPFIRAYAARTIGQNGMFARAAVLRLLVVDADTAVAADAAFALGSLHDTASAVVLAGALSRTPSVVTAAAWSLGELGEPGRAALESVMETGQPAASLPDVLQAAAKLRPLPTRLLVPYLAHSDVLVQRSAAYALTRSRAPAAVTALLALARRLSTAPLAQPEADAVVDLRSYVARGLARTVAGDSLGSEALTALRRLVDDLHPHVRINAIRSLATYGGAARADLVRRLHDPDANVRVALAQSLGGVLAVPSEDWSSAWASDTGFTYRRALLATSVRAGVRLAALDAESPGAWQRHADWRFRAAAAEAAGAGRQADVDAIAAPLLRDADARVRAAAYNAALIWADSVTAATRPYGRPALPAALRDEDLFVRASVLDALRSHARAPDASVAFAAWRRAAADPENDARVAALRVISAAWAADSGAFTTLRDSIGALAPPSDAGERAAVRGVTPLGAWSRVAIVPRPHSWYLQQVRNIVGRAFGNRPLVASIVTARGTIEIDLAAADAPLTVANFFSLAKRRYYDGLVFHRVVPNFVAQDGDPRGDGSGGPGYAIRDELNRRWYDRGALGMALSGPDTGGSQYFLTHSPQPHLDGHYTVFGHVTRGFDVLDALVQGDRILRITVQ